MSQMIPMDVELMLDFMQWGNDRVLAGARQLAPEQLISPIRTGFSSTLELLVHLHSAEWVWLTRWKGETPLAGRTVKDIPTLDALAAAWEPLRAEFRAYVTGVQDPARHQITYRTTKGEEFTHLWWPLFLHVFNHGTEHRSQVALYLAMNGIDLGNMDLVYWLRDRK